MAIRAAVPPFLPATFPLSMPQDTIAARFDLARACSLFFLFIHKNFLFPAPLTLFPRLPSLYAAPAAMEKNSARRVSSSLLPFSPLRFPLYFFLFFSIAYVHDGVMELGLGR